MDSFYIIVACVAIVLLILLLTVIGLMMSNQNKIDVYPPNKSQCPDYWIVNDDGRCIANDNTKVNGITYNMNDNIEKSLLKKIKVEKYGNQYYFDFSGNTVCDNKKWANDHSIQWDGYSNAATC